MDVLQSICNRITEFFFKGFGHPSDSKGTSGTLPIDATQKWIPIVGISTPAIVRIANTDAANTLEYTFNDKDTEGAWLPKQTIEHIEPIKGYLYMRSLDATKTCEFNVYIIALNTKQS